MKCKEIIRLIAFGRDAEPDVRLEITEHAFTCKKCREELTVNSLIKSILKSHNFTNDEHSVWDEVRLINQVKARIQSGRETGLGTWESAVISFRGWLVGFAAAAILLLALSSQIAVNNSTDKKDEGKLDLISNAQASSATEDMISNAQLPSATEDLISRNARINRQSEPTSEEVENVR